MVGIYKREIKEKRNKKLKIIKREKNLIHSWSKAPARFELTISCLLDRRFNQLSHGALLPDCQKLYVICIYLFVASLIVAILMITFYHTVLFKLTLYRFAGKNSLFFAIYGNMLSDFKSKASYMTSNSMIFVGKTWNQSFHVVDPKSVILRSLWYSIVETAYGPVYSLQ